MRSLLSGCVAAIVAVAVVTGASGNPGNETKTGQAAKPTLAVAIVGSGRVTSKPAGISCPGKCSATFAAGSRVLLTSKAKTGSRFLRWGGNCVGTRGCTVRVSALAAVAAQFTAGTKTKPQPPLSAVEPGSYSGQNSQNGNGVKFYVPPGGRAVLNFSIPATGLNCQGGGGISDKLVVLKTAIRQNRSFSAKTTQDGVIGGSSAKFTYSITGRFQGKNAAGAATATGTYREDIVQSDGTVRSCTTNDQSWTATRSGPPPPQNSIQPGNYSGHNSQNGNGVKFFVSPGGRTVLNFSIPATGLNCKGGGGISDKLVILEAAIRPDRSFTARTTQDGVIGGASAKFTYSITGYFQGNDSAGAATATGVYRQDMVSGTGRACTTNDQSWTATRSGG